MDKRIDMVYRMQKYLSILRKIAGWTTEELGKRIGVTKQTISNLENRKVAMSKTQYIAIRTVLEYEIQIVNENAVLKRAIEIVFNSKVSLNEQDEQLLYNALKNVAAAAVGGIEKQQLYMLSTTLLSQLKVYNGYGNDTSNYPYKWIEEI